MRTDLRLLRFAAPYKLRIALAILCKQLGRVGQLATAGMAGAERIFEVLDAESPVQDRGTRVLPPFERAIRFEGVGFSAEGDEDAEARATAAHA